MPTKKRNSKSPKRVKSLATRSVAPKKSQKVRGGATTTATGATVGRANFDVFTVSKNIDTATAK